MDAPQTAPSAAEFLASVEILSPFSRDEIERLADYAQARFYSFGETVCSAGEVADGLYVVRTGSVRI
ncbi:MAG TPA: cyclic nucleotide-binding domain-containing protein, partial [Paraburkholderia sp.]